MKDTGVPGVFAFGWLGIVRQLFCDNVSTIPTHTALMRQVIWQNLSRSGQAW